MISIEGFLLGCFLVTAIYHTLLFIFYKKNYAALYFAGITYASSILTLVKGTDWPIRFKIILLIFVIVPLFYVEFTRHMYLDEFDNSVSHIIHKIMYAYVGGFSLLIILLPMTRFMQWMPVMQKINFPVNMVLIVYMFVQLIRASRAKRSDARILLLGYAILFITAMIIYVVPNNMVSKNNPIGALGILLLYSGTLARRYAKAYHRCEMIVEERTDELMVKNTELTRLINRDTLTNAFSRRYVMGRLERLFIQSRETNRDFSIISFDLDHFKQVNDQYGHSMGDHVLIQTSRAIQNYLGETAELGRIGGEEFVVLLPNIDGKEAIKMAEDIREAVKSVEYHHKDSKFHVTCSLGVISMIANMKDYDDMLIKADQLLYQAKEKGRDRVCG